MRETKIAIQTALQTDAALAELVPAVQVFAVERATIPALPSIEIIGATSERQANALIRHEMAVEITVAHPTEDGRRRSARRHRTGRTPASG